MDVVFENISSLIFFTVVFLIVYATLLNVYFIHKNGFHVGVNCWFCNKNSKVLYSKRNSFECPYCFQYNGFKKDGGYNKVIEAQHNASLNARDIVPNQKNLHSTPKSSNGLCELCNRNQELKVIQLATYEALEERNYDKEIKHFEEQLEKTYGLCKTCSKTVKNTVRKQSVWIFGNRIKNIKNLKSHKNAFLSKSKNATKKSQTANNIYHRLSIVRIILLVLSLFNLSILCGLDVSLPKNILTENLLPYNVILLNTYSSVYNFSVTNFGHKNLMMYLPKTFKLQESSIFHISFLGLFVELLFSFIEKNCRLFSKLNKLFSWIILGLVSSINFKNDISLYFRTLEIFCSLYLIYMYSSTCIKPISKQPQKFHLKRIKRDLKNEDYSDNEESDSDSMNYSRASYRTAVNTHSPITASSFSNLNKSFESVRSRNSTLNNTLINNDFRTAKNVELNKHFNGLNIGALNSSIHRDYRSPASPNPFLNQNTRPQSPTSLYNGSIYNSPSSPFLNQLQHKHLFNPQSPRLNPSLNNVSHSPFNGNHTTPFMNPTCSVSPMSIRTEPLFTQNQSYNLTDSSYTQGFNQPSTSFSFKNNDHSNSFSPRDTSTVISQNVSSPRSPTYNLRSTRPNLSSPSPIDQEPSLRNSFRPLSPSSTLERPTRSLLSPSKFNNINSFHSDGRGNGSLCMSFHADGVPNSGIWANLNSSHLPQRFVVNSLANIQCNTPLNNSFVLENVDKNKLTNSRSSSTSSGFISNGDFIKGLSKSLPNSRDNSPERTSLLSEPVYR